MWSNQFQKSKLFPNLIMEKIAFLKNVFQKLNPVFDIFLNLKLIKIFLVKIYNIKCF